jgi:hypothetical protein
MKIMRKIAGLIIPCALLLLVSGCEDDDEYDHRPPAGQGALVIDNRSYDDIYVFIDGREVQRTPYRSWRAYDLNPGVRRVVLDQRGGDAYYAADIDILERKLTVLDVVIDYEDFYVRKWID